MFGVDLAGLRMHCGAVADDLTRAHGSLGLAKGRDVYLASEVGRMDPTHQAWILAHEVAHVVQQTSVSYRESAPAAEIELEACLAASAAQRGEAFHVQWSDNRCIPAAWGEAGHYYTVYLAMLAAGATAPTARQIAFFAQLPDEVREFDAIGIWWVANESLKTVSPNDKRRNELINQAKERIRRIQVGLHCLTGGLAEPEREFRTQTAIHAPDLLTLGVALHAFGDSFAHRCFDNVDMLYPSFAGHFSAGHAPDNIADSHRRGLYTWYARELYDIGRARFKHSSPGLDKHDFEAQIEQVTKKIDEPSQIDVLRKIATDIPATLLDIARSTQRGSSTGRPSSEFFPEKHGCASWDEFRSAQLGLDEHARGSIVRLAHRWTFDKRPAPTKKPVPAVNSPALSPSLKRSGQPTRS